MPVNIKKMNIPFHKAYITKEDINAVCSVLAKGWLTMGPKTVEFEKSFGGYIGARYAIAVNSCTAALHLALEAAGLKEGDEVIIPAITFPATSEVVCYFKARPVFADVEKETHNICVNKIEEKINKRTRAIIPVHYGGQPCDMDAVKRIAKRHRLYVIEDAAHALPSWYKGKKIGILGDVTCFSFYATKTLTTGEGGMITTENKKWADRMRTMRLHGMNRDAWKRYAKEGSWFYQIVDAGFKYNMTDIQAALGIMQLKKLEFMWRKRRDIAKKYNDAFMGIEEMAIPFVKDDRETSWHLYPIKLDLNKLKIDRNSFIKKLKEKGVGTSVHFIPLHLHPFYQKNFCYKRGDFPNAEFVYDRIISLPLYPKMSQKEVSYVIEAVKSIVKKFRK